MFACLGGKKDRSEGERRAERRTHICAVRAGIPPFVAGVSLQVGDAHLARGGVVVLEL